MKLSTSIRQIPRPIDPISGNAAAADWSGAMADLIDGAAGSSPYLAGLIASEGDWLKDAADEDAPMFRLNAELRLGPNLAQDLRQAKNRVALYVGLAELARAQPVLDGTAMLTRFADTAVDLAFKAAIQTFQQRGKLPHDVRWFVLAMGKMGAFELNYSSDIDLIVMLDDTDMDVATAHEYRSVMVKATRIALKTLSDPALGGYVFRTDVRLRPDPSVTPICVCTSQAMSYYESLGRTWERAAFIKARTCAGDLDAGHAFLKELHPFIWRKYLDFAAIEEAHDLRLKIRDKIRLPGKIKLPGHDIKLGRGGIREIEFYTQTRQLISGGRDPDLRDPATLPALAALTRAGWVPQDVHDALNGHYLRHRHVEHALQMVRDKQTQSLPVDDEGLDVIAALMGQSLPDFKRDTLSALEDVHSMTEAFFDPPKAEPAAPETAFQNDPSDDWPSYPALRSERAAKLFAKIRPQILTALSAASDPDDALTQFDAFLKGLPAGVQVFSLFAANPKLVELLTDIVSSSPALAHYLGSSARVLDGVLSGDFFGPWPGADGLTQDLTRRLSAATDYEAELNAARAWKKEWHFRVGVHLLQGLITPQVASDHYSELADVILAALLPRVAADFERKHGGIENAGWMILGMGSLGAKSLSADSDLDLMVIFDCDPNEMSDGKRSLAGRAYYSRLTQSLITAVTAPMPEGILYEVDMRLRPSGRAGPVATRIESFDTYQHQDAWTWEHLALTRARPIAGDKALCDRVEAIRKDVIGKSRDQNQTFEDVRDMRRRLRQEKPITGPWDMKNGPGGLMDIELMAQTHALLSGSNDRTVPTQLADAPELQNSYEILFAIKALHSVLCQHGTRTFEMGMGGWKVINHHCQVENLDDLNTKTSQLRRIGDAKITTGLTTKG